MSECISLELHVDSLVGEVKTLKKVLVIGCSGVGKSTFAKCLSQQTGLPYVATDPFYWEADWQLATTENVVKRVEQVTLQDAWILDGNFDAQRDLVWQRADTIIWLDYPLSQVAFQVTKRNLGLWLNQKSTWSGNRMTWARAWSGIRHALKSHSLKRENYPLLLNDVSHLQVFHFKRSEEATNWLKEHIK